MHSVTMGNKGGRILVIKFAFPEVKVHQTSEINETREPPNRVSLIP